MGPRVYGARLQRLELRERLLAGTSKFVQVLHERRQFLETHVVHVASSAGAAAARARVERGVVEPQCALQVLEAHLVRYRHL
eukprot:5966266-Prymnesium_polylepis.1